MNQRRRRMYFCNGRRMVNPNRIFYEQGVLNQTITFSSNRESQPETIYYVTQPVNNISEINGAYLQLQIQIIDGEWHYEVNKQKDLKVMHQDKKVIAHQSGVFLGIIDVNSRGSDLLCQVEQNQDLIYDSVIAISQSKQQDKKLFIVNISQLDTFKLVVNSSSIIKDANIHLLLVKISD